MQIYAQPNQAKTTLLEKSLFLLLAVGQACTDNTYNYFFSPTISIGGGLWGGLIWWEGWTWKGGGGEVPMPLQVRGGTVVHFESLPPLVLVVRPFWARHMLTCVKNYTSPKLSPSAPASHWLLAAAAAPENE